MGTADVAAAQGCDSFSMTICTLAKKTNLYIPFPYSKGLQDKHGLCTFKHKFVHTLCTFKHFHHINLYMRQLKTMRVVKGKTVMTTDAAVDTFKDINVTIVMVGVVNGCK